MMRKLLMTLLTFVFSLTASQAQTNELRKETSSRNSPDPLKGLRKANFSELDPSKPLMLDGIATPVYSANLVLIGQEELMKELSGGDFIPDVYIDSSKEVKAFVLRKTTALEKSQMIKMAEPMDGSNELVGKKAAAFSGTDMQGVSHSLESLKGKVIVINCWFVECKPCVMEMPELNTLVEKYKHKEVVFLGLAVNEKKKIEQFLQSKKFHYTIIPDAQDAISAYGVKSFPTHIIIDKASTVVFSTSGLGPTTIADLEKTIQSLLE
jgi:thiol-disulfide isomerase/thioredoxin